MQNDEIFEEEEEISTLTLTGDDGKDVTFEYLDCITYQETEYLVLLPTDEADADQLVILEVQPVDEENENYLAVEDEATLNAVYSIFKERFQDVFTFAD